MTPPHTIKTEELNTIAFKRQTNKQALTERNSIKGIFSVKKQERERNEISIVIKQSTSYIKMKKKIK